MMRHKTMKLKILLVMLLPWLSLLHGRAQEETGLYVPETDSLVLQKLAQWQDLKSADLPAQVWLQGYHRAVAGEVLFYHAPQPDADSSLLVRSGDSSRYIEWLTQPVPEDFSSDTARFLMLAGIDVNAGDPHTWKFMVDGIPHFTIATPLDTLKKDLTWAGLDGMVLAFHASFVDKYGDFMGYLILSVPRRLIGKGKVMDLKVMGESAGSRTWFMVFKYPVATSVRVVPENAVIKGMKGNYQMVRVEVVYYDKPLDAVIRFGPFVDTLSLIFGFNAGYFKIPAITKEEQVHLTVETAAGILADEIFAVKPVKPMTIYLLHHSHNDIGYTNLQSDVERMQWDNLTGAARLGDESRNFPAGAVFRWNTEVMWALDSYLAHADSAHRHIIMNAIKKGWIEPDAFFANELSALCNQRELIHLTEAYRRLTGAYGVEPQAAMISDIPGWTWGLVPILAKSNVKYLSIGNNSGDRVGTMNKTWGDKPFYWVSPSGHEKVLCWIHGKGYSFFHTGLGYGSLDKKLREDLVFSYMNELAANNYPYDMVTLRYNIGSDNGPVDEALATTVREWNEKYVSPKVVISTVGESFRLFEEKYGSQLPTYSGDLTAYWEDGAASSARETAMNRHNADRMAMAETLWAMLDPGYYPDALADAVWQNILLFDEHTWGSWNSISEPDSPFTLQQWKTKQSYVQKGDSLSGELLTAALREGLSQSPVIAAVEVFNTLTWPRTELVALPPGSTLAGFLISDADGNLMPSQVLTGGELAFMAQNVPPLGSKIFYLQPGEPDAAFPDREPYTLSSDDITLTLDTATGAIASLRDRDIPFDLVDCSTLPGLNGYYYVNGRNPVNVAGNSHAHITVKENGPLVQSLTVESQAPGARSLRSEIRLTRGTGKIDIITTIDKIKTLHPEGVHIAFPFHVPGGILRYDLAYAVCRAEKDQLPGSNRNYLTFDNYVDVSNDDYGVSWTSPDAPLIEPGAITNDATVYGWIEHLKPNQTFYSYIMNNYWGTNYCASQEGPVTFSYSLAPHGKFNPAEAEKFGLEQRQPLIVRPVGVLTQAAAPLFHITTAGIITTEIKPVGDGKDILVTLYNVSGKTAPLIWTCGAREIHISNFDGDTLGPAGVITMDPWDIITLRLIY